MQKYIIKPCPLCRGKNLSFKHEMSYGHGDCGFSNARIECDDCSLSIGKGYDYGNPSFEDELKA